MTGQIRLSPEPKGPMHAFGSVTYRVHLDGRWIGWVSDFRPWMGHRYGGRRWYATWRQDGDQHARSNSDDVRTRREALAWLTRTATEPTETNEPTERKESEPHR